jgi:hypothetical protein
LHPEAAMKNILALLAIAALPALANAACPYDPNCLTNPYGAGSPYSSTPIYVVPEE